MANESFIESQFHNGSITTFLNALGNTLNKRSQFHNGSITTFISFASILEAEQSQFHNGSITTDKLLPYIPIAKASLNSTMVRLQPPFLTCHYPFTLRLNSTMVRLQLCSIHLILMVNTRSQFHNGSITTYRFLKRFVQSFGKGLNSTMVRLQLNFEVGETIQN